MSLLLALSSGAWASVAPECRELANAPIPRDYDEVVQTDFLQNYFALATTLSPVHGPIPHAPGRGAIGVDLGVVPPLGCPKRLVFRGTAQEKTEDPNKAPVIPRPRLTFAFPALGKLVPYAGLAYAPPLEVFGTTNVIVSAEVGAGAPLGEHFQLGGRFHATSHKTVAEIATPFEKGQPALDDLFVAATFGLDVLAGYDLEVVTPYVALGWTDASTLFYVGDDGVLVNNLHPYFGPTFSAGADALVKDRFRVGGEFYGAPGGTSTPDPDVRSVDKRSRYGRLFTARFRLGVEL